MTHLFIITGNSRGLGQAIAQQLISPTHYVVGIARQRSAALDGQFKTPTHRLGEQWEADLATPLTVALQLQLWLQTKAKAQFPSLGSITLINNAAYLVEPDRLGQQSNEDLIRAMDVGLTAPLLLCNAFLNATQDWPIQKRILNISSGLGRRAMAGSVSYCATKAGMDHLSRAIALEQQELKYPASVCSLAPGVIDTDMQVQLRSASPAAFSSQNNFSDLKQKGLLDSPDTAAAKVLAYLARANFGEPVVADVRDPA